MHHFGHFDPAGSVHTGLTIAELAPGGMVAPHVHSYEESFYLLSGDAILRVNDSSYRLGPGDLGALKVGTVHAWRAAGSATRRMWRGGSSPPGWRPSRPCWCRST